MKKIITVITAAFVFSFVTVAGAQTPPTTSSSGNICPISLADFEALAAIQNNPDLSVAEELNQELTLRKQLMSRTIACAAKDADSLKVELDAISVTKSTADIASLLANKINETLNFYNLESTKLNDAGIRATEIIAKETLAWRAANYLPLESQVKNFALFSKNQDLFRTAENRLAKTDRVVSLIEATAQNSDLRTGLNAVRSSLADAEIQNSAALNALRALLPPDQSSALIEQSLQSLADTYQKFGVLNDLIQKLLPTQ